MKLWFYCLIVVAAAGKNNIAIKQSGNQNRKTNLSKWKNMLL